MTMQSFVPFTIHFLCRLITVQIADGVITTAGITQPHTKNARGLGSLRSGHLSLPAMFGAEQAERGGVIAAFAGGNGRNDLSPANAQRRADMINSLSFSQGGKCRS